MDMLMVQNMTLFFGVLNKRCFDICFFENISRVSGVKVSKSFKENFEGLYILPFHKN